MATRDIFEPYRVRNSSLNITSIGPNIVSRSGNCIQFKGVRKETYHYGYLGLGNEIVMTALKHCARYGLAVNFSFEHQLLFHNQWSTGYYHWLIESIPRLLALKQHWGNTQLLIPERLPNEWFSGWLEEISNGNFLKLRRGVTFSRGIICQRNPRLMADFSSSDLHAIGEYFRGYFDIPQHMSRGKKIYITRRAANHRRVSNEDEIIGALEERGFITVELEELEFPEQVLLFSQADIVVSVHGAGLSNMVFLQPGMKVVEFIQKPDPQLTFGTRRNTHLLNPCFRAIASAMNLDYSYVLGELDLNTTSVEILNRYGSLHGNIKVRLDDLMGLI